MIIRLRIYMPGDLPDANDDTLVSFAPLNARYRASIEAGGRKSALVFPEGVAPFQVMVEAMTMVESAHKYARGEEEGEDD